MHLQRRPSVFAFVAFATFALCLSCTGSEAATGTGGGRPLVGRRRQARRAPRERPARRYSGAAGSRAPVASRDAGTRRRWIRCRPGGSRRRWRGRHAAGTAGTGGGAAGRGGTGGGAAGRGGSGGWRRRRAGTAVRAGAAARRRPARRARPAPVGAGGMPASSGCGKPTTLTSGRASIDVAGKTREYILALPTNYDQNHPYRLIFGWHPWGGSAQQIASGWATSGSRT